MYSSHSNLSHEHHQNISLHVKCDRKKKRLKAKTPKTMHSPFLQHPRHKLRDAKTKKFRYDILIKAPRYKTSNPNSKKQLKRPQNQKSNRRTKIPENPTEKTLEIKQITLRYFSPLKYCPIQIAEIVKIHRVKEFHNVKHNLKRLWTDPSSSLRRNPRLMLQNTQIRIQKSHSLISIIALCESHVIKSIIVLIQDVPLIKFVLSQLRYLDMRHQRVVLVLYHIRHQLIFKRQLHFLHLYSTIFRTLCIKQFEPLIWILSMFDLLWSFVLWNWHLLLYHRRTILTKVVLAFLYHWSLSSFLLFVEFWFASIRF